MTMKKNEQNASGEVKVTYDPSVIRKNIRTKEEAERLKKEASKEKLELIGHNTNSKLGLESSLGKDENKMKLLSAFDRGDVFTTTAGASLLGLAPSTILRYAKELEIALFDADKQKWLDGRKPKCMEPATPTDHSSLSL